MPPSADSQNRHPQGEQGPGQGLLPSRASLPLHASPRLYVRLQLETHPGTIYYRIYNTPSYVWGVINTAGETKSSRFLLVVSEQIYGKQFV